MFYADLFVDYVQAVISQGVYSVEDAIVFDEVLGKCSQIDNDFRAV